MNREGAETFLRLLAEAEMRDQLTPHPPPWAGGPGAGRVKVNVVGQALTAVGALDRETVQDILADFDLAVSLRHLHDKHGPGPARTVPPGALPTRTMRAASAARLAAQLPFGRSGPAAGPGWPGWPGWRAADRPGAPDHPGRRPRSQQNMTRVRVRRTGSCRSAGPSRFMMRAAAASCTSCRSRIPARARD